LVKNDTSKTRGKDKTYIWWTTIREISHRIHKFQIPDRGFKVVQQMTPSRTGVFEGGPPTDGPSGHRSGPDGLTCVKEISLEEHTSGCLLS
jgi:hypothetical protein